MKGTFLLLALLLVHSSYQIVKIPFQRITSLSQQQGQTQFEDVGDMLYNVEVTFGNNAHLWLQLDTGSQLLWASGTAATSQYINCDSSNQCAESGTFMNNLYGSGYVQGNIATANISVAGIQIPNFEFLFANEISNFPNSFYQQSSGILGMASNESQPFPMFIQLLADQNLISSPIFSLYLGNVSLGNTESTGELILGEIESSYTNGSQILYTQASFVDAWLTTLESISFGGFSATVGLPAAIDTGTSTMAFPSQIQSEILAEINSEGGECGLNEETGLYFCYCVTVPELIFEFSGCSVGLPGNFFLTPIGVENGEAICMLEIQPVPSDVNVELAILGDTFLRNFYIIFDSENSEIGFVQQSGTIPSQGTKIWLYVGIVALFLIIIGAIVWNKNRQRTPRTVVYDYQAGYISMAQ